MVIMKATGSPSTSATRIRSSNTIGLSFLPRISDFGVGEGDEAPIVAPRVVEDADDQRRLFGEARFVDLADADAPRFSRPLRRCG